MHRLEHARLADELLPAVLQAGRIDMDYFSRPLDVELKSDQSPVTKADRESEALIHEALTRIAPEIPVVGEEAMSEGRVPDVEDTFFLVDPIDGTKEFIKGRDEFTINIGLVRRGVPDFGLIYAPARSVLFVTLEPGHAVQFRLSPGQSARSLAGVEGRQLKTRVPDPRHIVELASRSHRDTSGAEIVRHLSPVEIWRLGSSLKFCLLARGDADIYVRPGATSEWDTAAGQAILTAAGGLVTTLEGKALVYGKRDENFVNRGFVAWGHKSLMERG